MSASSDDPADERERELQRCVQVLEALADDRGGLAAVEPELRRRLLTAAGKLSRPDKHERVRLAKALRRKDCVEQKAHDARLLESTEMRSVRRAPVYVALPPASPEASTTAATETELLEPRSCYVCKEPFRRLHFFYDSMCPSCAELNYAKRFQSAPMDGQVALVTGGRLKIGYQTALLLLRAGARVVVTTRFPRDAALRYAREPDFDAWSSRLELHGLDLRHAPSVELFTQHLDKSLGRLDHIINNAAQTVRRPARFYDHLLALEEASWDDVPLAARPLLGAHEDLRRALAAGQLPHGARADGSLGDAGGGEIVRWHAGGPAMGLLAPARMSQLPLTEDDVRTDVEIFPTGHYDADLQQVDLRRMNSWRMQAADVSTPELLEVHLVNAIAPFLLNSRLRPLLERDRTDAKHIVNVSAMEAQFSRKKKTDKHPHTNMAKAALNMMTRTSAPEYAAAGIWMNSVDTGWVTDEDPSDHVVRKQDVHDFHPPLDIVDGAARICDPIFVGLNSGEHPYGVFFKDYRPTDW